MIIKCSKYSIINHKKKKTFSNHKYLHFEELRIQIKIINMILDSERSNFYYWFTVKCLYFLCLCDFSGQKE